MRTKEILVLKTKEILESSRSLSDLLADAFEAKVKEYPETVVFISDVVYTVVSVDNSKGTMQFEVTGRVKNFDDVFDRTRPNVYARAEELGLTSEQAEELQEMVSYGWHAMQQRARKCLEIED